MLNLLRRFGLLFSTLVLGTTFLMQTVAFALPPEDQHALIYGSEWYDPNLYNFATCDGGGKPTGSGTGGPTGKVPADWSLGTGAAQRQANLIKALMDDYGLTPSQAAGPVGNFMREASGTSESAAFLPPDVNQGTTKGAPPAFSGGYGWAQWTGSRQHTFINYAVRGGYMASDKVRASDAADYAFLKSELNSSMYKNTIIQLKKQATPEAAAVSFEATFERAGEPALEERKANARKAYNAYNSIYGTGTNPTTPTPENGTTPVTGCSDTGGVGTDGTYAFPLSGTKKVVKNPGMFHDGTADRGGHPYIAYDILADPGTPVVAFMEGEVTHHGLDKCPGRLISVYNKKSNMVVSYLHMNTDERTHIAMNVPVAVGEKIGLVGGAPAGCGIPHLHIDAAKGKDRPPCKREDCPSANAAKFINIGPQLYQTYQKLPN